jgi:hypothetical protein
MRNPCALFVRLALDPACVSDDRPLPASPWHSMQWKVGIHSAPACISRWHGTLLQVLRKRRGRTLTKRIILKSYLARAADPSLPAGTPEVRQAEGEAAGWALDRNHSSVTSQCILRMQQPGVLLKAVHGNCSQDTGSYLAWLKTPGKSTSHAYPRGSMNRTVQVSAAQHTQSTHS